MTTNRKTAFNRKNTFDRKITWIKKLLLGAALVAGTGVALAAPRHNDHDARTCNDRSHNHAQQRGFQDRHGDHRANHRFDRRDNHRGHHRGHHRGNHRNNHRADHRAPKHAGWRWWAGQRHGAAHWRDQRPVRYRGGNHGAPHRFDAGCREVTIIRRDRHGRPYEVRQSACRDRHGDLVVRDRSVGRLRR